MTILGSAYRCGLKVDAQREITQTLKSIFGELASASQATPYVRQMRRELSTLIARHEVDDDGVQVCISCALAQLREDMDSDVWESLMTTLESMADPEPEPEPEARADS
jgi:hypothetical protein